MTVDLCDRRLAALESGQTQQPSRSSQQPVTRHPPAKQKGLSKKDAVIAERLQKLKDATKPGFIEYIMSNKSAKIPFTTTPNVYQNWQTHN